MRGLGDPGCCGIVAEICGGNIGIMEKKMETIGVIGVILGLYRGYIGIMEKKMETTIVYWGYIKEFVGVWGGHHQGHLRDSVFVGCADLCADAGACSRPELN